MALKTEYVNKIVSGKGSSVNVRALPGTSAKVLLTLKTGQTAGRSTGQTNNMSDGEWVQIAFYSPVLGEKYGYARRDLINIVNVPGTEPVKTDTNSYKNDYVNKIVTGANTFNVHELPSLKSPVLLNVKKGSTAGRSSGQYNKMSDGEWLQVNLYAPVFGKKYGYVKKTLVSLLNPTTGASNVAESNAEAMVTDLLKNDKGTLANLQKLYTVIGKLKKQGVDVSKIEPEFKKYLDRLMQRQVNLIKAEASGLITITKVLNSGIKVSNDFHKKFGLSSLEVKQIGIAPVVLIVGGVVIGAIAAAAIYYLVKPDYEDSKLDFKITSNLQKEIDKYIPKEKQAEFNQVLQQEAQPQLTEAFNSGKTDQKFGDIMSVGKYILIFGAGFYLVDKLITTQSAKRAKAR